MFHKDLLPSHKYKYLFIIEEVKNDCSQRIAVIESQCVETLELTRIECVKLTTLFKNSLETEKKKNSKKMSTEKI